MTVSQHLTEAIEQLELVKAALHVLDDDDTLTSAALKAAQKASDATLYLLDHLPGAVLRSTPVERDLADGAR